MKYQECFLESVVKIKICYNEKYDIPPAVFI